MTDTQLEYRQAPIDFDRSIMPKVATSVKAHMPSLYRVHFDNGAESLVPQALKHRRYKSKINLPAGERHAATKRASPISQPR